MNAGRKYLGLNDLRGKVCNVYIHTRIVGRLKTKTILFTSLQQTI